MCQLRQQSWSSCWSPSVCPLCILRQITYPLLDSISSWVKCCCSSVTNTSVTQWTAAARLLCPWDFPDKNTSVGCHFLLHGIFPTRASNHLQHWQVDSLPLSHPGSPICSLLLLLLLLSHFSRVRLCVTPPGFPIPGILQARTLEWVAISFSSA